ncbi:Ppx/GppA phosphatase [Pseudopedobacter saltans DSM 12145]|uniref:Ppx/GppA phosphatase n=1 Tax=Pseudopedobacter saltans (strain ATCC 51119 / DSM 12145 / JCM 21818 / CCUG 39354 / LMG 10337 / NBRC 100064 / NCIMB 13643) TaxID=762903 RepID=F0SDK7_PSESL|nr:ethanolamine ammonia-lyase reactivating factor EutA [Pseudopedobacter saltans]ADY50734.1 Ppx/GppA phosphatase [Pseudopedobacter saltans DSM 12145]
MKYAAIDIGSNAIRLLIAEVKKEGSYRTYKKTSLIRVPLRLGDDSFMNKKLSKSKAEDFFKTMQAFKNLMEVHEVEEYMACATSAMREAKNGQEIIDKVNKKLGMKIEIVAGAKEASIIYASHAEEHLDKSKSYLYIDVGGGSTELSLFHRGKINYSKSFNLGTIRILDGQDRAETWRGMKLWLEKYVVDLKLSAIGTGGNINKLFRLSGVPDGTALSKVRLTEIADYLKSHTLQERIDKLGLNKDRADVIIPASEIFLYVMNYGKINEVYVPRLGMVDGIIETLMNKYL